MNKGILFFVGLLAGSILGSASIYFIDKKKFNSVPLTKEKEVIVIRVDTVYIETPLIQNKQDIENKSDKHFITENIETEQTENEVSFCDSEFSFEGRDGDEIFSDQWLETKIVKVTLRFPEKQEGKLSEFFFQFFEIQRWSTVIKNKKTYYRNKNMIKIKGMNIDNVNVVFWNDSYFLEINNLYYAIPETEYFEKLNVINLTP